MSELLTSQGSRTLARLHLEGFRNSLLKKSLPKAHLDILPSSAYQITDAAIALTTWEAELMQILYGADPARIRIVPNGVEEVFFADPKTENRKPKTEWLVCTATIHPRKRVLELAQAAVHAQTPVWIIGKPYAEAESYYQEFLRIQKRNPKLIRYEGAIEDRALLANIYQTARGFTLLSTMESQSLSALEAAAAGCPLLLSDLPWARCTFESHATYCPANIKTDNTAAYLKTFYEKAPTKIQFFKPLKWKEVAQKLKSVYESF